MIRAGFGRKTWGLLLAAGLIASCGIDQGGMPPAAQDPVVAARNRAVLVSGPITGFGSVLVNGLRLDASTAQILVDGQLAAESDLRVGQIVRAVASPNGAAYRASSIEYAANVVGPIESIDLASGTLSVLEQPIVVDTDTRFEPPLTGPSDLMPGMAVAVSGLPMPSAALHATFVRAVDASSMLKIAGSISSVDDASLSFDVGLLRVDYSQAMLLDLAGGVPTLGQIVEARGTSLSGSTLLATEVRVRESLPGSFTAAAAALTDFEASVAGSATASLPLDVNFIGYISAVDSPGSIAIADVIVVLDKDTVVVGGTIAQLDAGIQVNVQGSVLSPGRIMADRIELL